MKILHVIQGKASPDRSNGVNQMVAALAKGTNLSTGNDAIVLGLANSVVQEGEVIERDGFYVTAFAESRRKFKARLKQDLRQADIVHLHGVFSLFNVLVANECRKAAVPYIVSAHNGMSPELIRMSGLYKKAVFYRLLQRKVMSEAAAIHAITKEEQTDLENLNCNESIFMVHNGIDLDRFTFSYKNFESPRGLNLGFLGRLSNEKNIANLCLAFVEFSKVARAQLLLAGPSTSYSKKLLDEFEVESIRTKGELFGSEKLAFLRSLNVFVHPSYCDGISYGVLEAMAVGTPVLVTRQSKVAYFSQSDAFVMCEPTKTGLLSGIYEVLKPSRDLGRQVKNARTLVESEFDCHNQARKFAKFYESFSK